MSCFIMSIRILNMAVYWSFFSLWVYLSKSMGLQMMNSFLMVSPASKHSYAATGSLSDYKTKIFQFIACLLGPL